VTVLFCTSLMLGHHATLSAVALDFNDLMTLVLCAMRIKKGAMTFNSVVFS